MDSQPMQIYNNNQFATGGPMKKHRRLRLGTSLLVAIVLVTGVLVVLLNIYQLKQMREEHGFHTDKLTVMEGTAGKDARTAPVVWIRGKMLAMGSRYMSHIATVFERLGFMVSNGDDDWDVLWDHDYPFVNLKKVMTALKPHQRVNRYPGSGFITNKGNLATSISKSIPRAFKIPKDKSKFLAYSNQHPDTMWVQKNNNHRGVHITNLQGLDLKQDGSFLQEYIDKPLLIDGRKFDIGVYSVMTSLSPLRIYTMDEVLFRFCAKPYHPFDPDVVDKYVVRDNYMPVWEMPSLKETYTTRKYGFKDTFNHYMKTNGWNVTRIWADIYDTIRTIYLEKQPRLIKAGSKYKSTSNFFELVRFDFVLDETGKLYLMEVNMSPNLSTNHFMANKQLYEHVVYNVLRVTRVASMVENHFHNTDEDTANMLVSDKDVAVFIEWCTLKECSHNCAQPKCAVCSQCMSVYERRQLKDAFLEHINRSGCRRQFPPPMRQDEALAWTPTHDTFHLDTYREKERAMFVWFIGMCRKDITWCA